MEWGKERIRRVADRRPNPFYVGLTDHVGGSIVSLVFGLRPHNALQLSLSKPL